MTGIKTHSGSWTENRARTIFCRFSVFLFFIYLGLFIFFCAHSTIHGQPSKNQDDVPHAQLV